MGTRQASAPPEQIKITDEMVEAGVEVLWESGALMRETPMADHLLVSQILESALALYSGPRTRGCSL